MKSDETPNLILVNALYDGIDSRERGFQLGLLYISTYVEEKGFRTKILVGENVTKRIIWELERSQEKPLLGFYVSADNEHEVIRCATVVKSMHPDCPIIFGGPEARVKPEQILNNKVADYVCTGDGEDCVLDLMNVLFRNNGTLEKVPNLAYLNGDKLKFGHSPHSKANLDLDRLPIPKRESFDPRYMDPSMIATARGCVSKCTFCFEGTSVKLRRHSVARVIEEMKYLQNTFATKYFAFTDDTFTSDARKVYDLSAAIAENFHPHVDATWYCEAKVSDLCRDINMAKTMVGAGLVRAQVGSESGNQNILDLYRKEIETWQIVEATEMLYDSGIVSIFTNFIIGGVCETIKTFEESLELALSLMHAAPGVLECASTFLSPYSGTDIRLNPERYDVELVDDQFITGSSDSYIFARSKHLTSEQVLSMGKEFYSAHRNAMDEIYPSLSSDIIRRQLEMGLFGLTSNWHQYLVEDGILARWFDFRRRGYDKQISPEESKLSAIIPTRTMAMESSSQDKFIWLRRKRLLRFSALEKALIELASGKITLPEIVERTFTQFGNDYMSKHTFQTAIIDFYNRMADEFLICFRRFS